MLVLGGGVAGCHTAIMAARKGAKVAVVDKGAVIYSGSGGAGVDHWHGAIGNPCCKLTLDDMIQFFDDQPHNFTGEYGNGITFYILMKDSYDVLLDIEKMRLSLLSLSLRPLRTPYGSGQEFHIRTLSGPGWIRSKGLFGFVSA